MGTLKRQFLEISGAISTFFGSTLYRNDIFLILSSMVSENFKFKLLKFSIFMWDFTTAQPRKDNDTPPKRKICELGPVYMKTSVKTQRLYCIYTLFSYCFQIIFISFSAVYTKTMKMIENGKNQKNLLFVCQDNLNNLWLLLHRFQKFAFSVKTIIVLIVFLQMQNENAKKSLRFQ